MTTLNQNLTAFAQAVGVDIRTLNLALQGKVTQEQLNQAIEDLRNALLGGASADLDTLKELADKLEELKTSDVGAGIVEKLSQLKTSIDEITTALNADLVETYNAAKV